METPWRMPGLKRKISFSYNASLSFFDLYKIVEQGSDVKIALRAATHRRVQLNCVERLEERAANVLVLGFLLIFEQGHTLFMEAPVIRLANFPPL
jgi:hypothetical protein